MHLSRQTLATLKAKWDNVTVEYSQELPVRKPLASAVMLLVLSWLLKAQLGV